MSRERIIRKVHKLLALANSSNEHEAALAAAHAQRLLAEHNLTLSEMELRQDGAGETELKVARTVPKWLSSLFAVVARAFDCLPIVSTTPDAAHLRCIGVGEDPQVAVCTLEFLMKELRRLATAYIRKQDIPASRLSVTGRRRIRDSYLLGGVQGVQQAMTIQKAVTPTTTGALVPVKDALIRQYREEHLGPLRTQRSRRSTVISDAFRQGRQDGAALQTRQTAAKNLIT